jgi:hypothetical protein
MTRRIYRKEEEFLEDWYETVDAVVAFLRGDWRPNLNVIRISGHCGVG